MLIFVAFNTVVLLLFIPGMTNIPVCASSFVKVSADLVKGCAYSGSEGVFVSEGIPVNIPAPVLIFKESLLLSDFTLSIDFTFLDLPLHLYLHLASNVSLFKSINNFLF